MSRQELRLNSSLRQARADRSQVQNIQVRKEGSKERQLLASKQGPEARRPKPQPDC